MEKKHSVSCIFKTIIEILVIKILEKYLFKSSILEINFKKSLYYINLGFKPQILEHLLWRTIPLVASDPCGILVDKT